MKNPKTKMWSAVVIFFVLMALALFLSAGTIHYWQGWAYLGVGAVSSVLLTRSIIRNPVLLESRTKGARPRKDGPFKRLSCCVRGFPTSPVSSFPALTAASAGQGCQHGFPYL